MPRIWWQREVCVRGYRGSRNVSERRNTSVSGMTAGDDLARAIAVAVDAPENLTTAEMTGLLVTRFA